MGDEIGGVTRGRTPYNLEYRILIRLHRILGHRFSGTFVNLEMPENLAVRERCREI